MFNKPKTAKLIFHNYQVIVEQSPILKEHIQSILDNGYAYAKSETEMAQIEAEEYNNIVFLTFSKGSVFPLPPNLINIKNKSKTKNKRTEMEYEPEFLYGLIDLKKGVAWLQYHAFSLFKQAIEESNPNKYIEIKQVLDEEEFVKRINELSQIKLAVLPNILGGNIELTEHIQEDIYNYGAEYAEIIFHYKRSKPIEFIKDTIKKIIKNKTEYKKLVISGRDIHNLEMIFNTNLVSSKVSIITTIDGKGIPNKDELFKELQARIIDITK